MPDLGDVHDARWSGSTSASHVLSFLGLSGVPARPSPSPFSKPAARLRRPESLLPVIAKAPPVTALITAKSLPVPLLLLR